MKNLLPEEGKTGTEEIILATQEANRLNALLVELESMPPCELLYRYCSIKSYSEIANFRGNFEEKDKATKDSLPYENELLKRLNSVNYYMKKVYI